MTQHFQTVFSALLLGASLLPSLATADGIDDFNNSWAGRALRLQRLLDLDTPFHDLNVVGAHNAFNSAAYASGLRYLDPNQSYSIFNLLRMGVRAVEFDVHWTPNTEGFSFPDRLLLCHGTADHIGCSLDDRYFAEGLDEISAWLGTADSIDQVLLLHIEDHMDGRHGEAFQQVDSRIGSRVYFSGGCGDIPGTLTKADVLAAGKNVIIWNEGSCSGDGSWNSMVFTGLGGMARVWEDSTAIGGGSVPAIGANEVASYFAGDTNIVDLDQLHENDGRWAAAVWSWDLGEPNNIGDEDCALQIANGRWNDADCDQSHVFACENSATGGWAVTSTTGPWGAGGLACDSLGPDYRFSVPTNSLDNQLLNNARIPSGHSTAWLNYDDRAAEGVWESSDADDIFFGAGAFRLDADDAVYGKTRMLRMEPNCNLVLYSLDGDVVGGGLWTSGTANRGTECHVEFQDDGNFVLYDGGGQALWDSSTSGAELRLQADGNLVIYDGSGNSLWNTFTDYPPEVVLVAGQFSLASGQIRHSAHRKWVLQPDCNLELYSFENGITGGVVWRSGTAGAGTGCHADFQDDGNFVLYDEQGDFHWASGTSGTVGAQLRMQADGNVVLYNGANEPLWSTYTNASEEILLDAGAFSLSAGKFVQSANRKLELADDCELVVSSVDNFVVGGVLWRSNTANADTGCYADLQDDGNFVLYDDEDQALWAAGTSGTVGAQLRLQPDGNLVIYNGANEPLWATYTNLPSDSTFFAGQFSMLPGQFVRHDNRLLEFGADCELVLYRLENALPGLRLWDTATAGAGSDCRLDFQDDGNLVLYDGNGSALWSTGTSGTSGARFRIQADGNMVVYNGAGEALWTSQTPGNFSEVAVCDDATCNGYEDCSSCASDCGECAPICSCGDSIVEEGCGEQCDDGGVASGDGCDATCRIEICAAVPREGCHEVERAKFQYSEKREGREQLRAQWKKIVAETVPTEFGDPVSGSTEVALCLYDDSDVLVQPFVVDRAGDLCGTKPCWSRTGSKGYRYKDREGIAAGMQQLAFVAGDGGRGKADAKGRNNVGKGQTALPAGVVDRLSGQSAPTVQLVTDAGFCLTATMTDVRRDDGLQYKAEKR